MAEEPPWVALKDVHHLYGMTIESAYNAVKAGRFPVPTYKAGKLIVIDREVHAQFFAMRREAGLRELSRSPLAKSLKKGKKSNA